MNDRPEPWLKPGPLRGFLLRVLSRLYRLGWACLRALRPGKPWAAPVPVLSVGNLSVGGTGKSLLVRALVERARGRGLRPAILLRGYGSAPGPRPLRVSAEGPDSLSSGDEAREHALACGVPVWVDPDRKRSARAALAEGSDCLVLDDGFQRRWQIARSLDLLLVDFSEALAGERLLPAGPFREPWSQIRHCDLVLVSGAPAGLEGGALKAALPPAWQAKEVFRLDREPAALLPWPTGGEAPLAFLDKKRVLALSGLGHPEGFESLLEALGAEVRPWRFPDHHRFSPAELGQAPFEADCVVTTAKDAVRLPAGWNPPWPVLVLQVRAEPRPAQDFWDRVDARMQFPPQERPS